MKPYKVLSAKTATTLSLAAIALTSVLVLALGHRSVVTELEITTALLAVLLFVFLTAGLYLGVRLEDDPFFRGGWKPFKRPDLSDLSSAGDFISDDWGGEGFLGVILAILAWIGIAIGALLFLFLLGNMLWGIVAFLVIMLYWIFYRAYRYVFLKGSSCRGRPGLSLLYGGLFTLLYTGWVFVLLAAGSWILRRHGM